MDQTDTLTLQEVLSKLDNSIPENERQILLPDLEFVDKIQLPKQKTIYEKILTQHYDGMYHIDSIITQFKAAKKEGATHLNFEIDYSNGETYIEVIKFREETKKEAEKRIKQELKEKIAKEKESEKAKYNLYLELKKQFENT